MLKLKHIVPAIELLGIGSLTAVGLAVGGPIGAGVMGAIGLNLSSNLLEGAKTQLKEKWLNGEYGALNHDIQQALVKALNCLASEYFHQDSGSKTAARREEGNPTIVQDAVWQRGKVPSERAVRG